jgi:hypothetical protein
LKAAANRISCRRENIGNEAKKKTGQERIDRHISWGKVLSGAFLCGLRGSEEEKRDLDMDLEGGVAAPD